MEIVKLALWPVAIFCEVGFANRSTLGLAVICAVALMVLPLRDQETVAVPMPRPIAANDTLSLDELEP